jgi:hypothetical protein
MLRVLILPANVKRAALELCNVCVSIVRVVHRRDANVGAAAVLWIAMRHCHVPEPVESVVLRFTSRPSQTHDIVFDSRCIRGMRVARGAPGAGAGAGAGAGTLAGPTLHRDAVNSLLQVLKRLSMRAPSDEELVARRPRSSPSPSPTASDAPGPGAGAGGMSDEKYEALVARARAAHVVFVGGLYQTPDVHTRDLLRVILDVPTLTHASRQAVLRGADAVCGALVRTKCGHNMDHRCGAQAFLILRHFLCIPSEMAQLCVARRCNTNVATIINTVAALVQSKNAAIVNSVAAARAAFDRAVDAVAAENGMQT